MSTKFTPGPWEVIGKQGTAVWAGDRIVAQMNAPREQHSIARANAQLIAQSPRMFLLLAKLADRIPSGIDLEYWPELAVLKAEANHVIDLVLSQ